MTPDKLETIRIRLDMRQADLAILADVTERCVRMWVAGIRPVPRPVALLLHAIDEGHITEPWLLRKLKKV